VGLSSLAGLGPVGRRRRGERRRHGRGQTIFRRHLVVVLGVLYGIAHYVGQGKGWEYHVYPLAAFAAVLAFASWRRHCARADG